MSPSPQLLLLLLLLMLLLHISLHTGVGRFARKESYSVSHKQLAAKLLSIMKSVIWQISSNHILIK